MSLIKGELKKTDNAFCPETLDVLLERGNAMGIGHDNILVLPARASLKAIGDKNLTRRSSNGVGNSLGYEFVLMAADENFVGSRYGNNYTTVNGQKRYDFYKRFPMRLASSEKITYVGGDNYTGKFDTYGLYYRPYIAVKTEGLTVTKKN